MDVNEQEIKTHLARRLVELRAALGQSQDEAAAAMEISQAALSRYELGSREPAVSVAVRICLHYGVPMADLLGVAGI